MEKDHQDLGFSHKLMRKLWLGKEQMTRAPQLQEKMNLMGKEKLQASVIISISSRESKKTAIKQDAVKLKYTYLGLSFMVTNW